jgi:lipopolysaccharide transport system permease protein
MLNDILKLFEYREMLKNTVRKELRARYKGSVLGFFWTFLNPLLMLIVYSVVFSMVLRVKIPNYSYTIYLFVGLVPWTFFSTAVQQSTNTIIANGNLIKKVYFPRIILPVSLTLTNLVNMLLTFIIVFLALMVSGAPVTLLYFYLPCIILIESLLALAFSMILSSVTVYFRDLEHIVGVLLMAWFYLTPIVYTIDYVPQRIMYVFRLNPMLPIIDSYRDVLMFNKVPDLSGILYAFMFSLLLLVAGYYIFNSLQKRFAEEI